MAEASCPASCGELIQGWISGGEKLVSCPINWFSTVEVSTGDANLSRQRPMMRKALELTLNQLHIPKTESLQLKIDFQSTIPVAKGMASSTADIAATIAATYRHFKTSCSAHQIAALCTLLEPTDSTMFQPLTLFEHKKGSLATSYGSFENLDILILENQAHIKTCSFHQIDNLHKLLSSSNALGLANKILIEAVAQQDPRKLGLASTISAIENQTILLKPHFLSLLKLVEKHDLYGLNVAHSGSVVGLLCNTREHDTEKIAHEISKLKPTNSYTSVHLNQIIKGGIR